MLQLYTKHMHQYLAHTEDLHTANTSTLVHSVTEPYVAVPLFVAAAVVLFLILRRLFGLQIDRVFLILLALFLVSGVATYSLVPAVSIVSLTAGIVLALFLSLASIGKK